MLLFFPEYCAKTSKKKIMGLKTKLNLLHCNHISHEKYL